MLDTAEALLAESGGRRLVLSDIAARIGCAQSYIHLHFRTKRDLISALAARWFAKVEQAVKEADSQGSPEDRLRRQVLATLEIKRAAFDRDPVLFRAYLRLAADHEDVVRAHTDRLIEYLSKPLRELVGDEGLEDALQLVEDATAQFRVPHMIVLKRGHATEERARRVLDAVLAGIGRPAASGPAKG